MECADMGCNAMTLLYCMYLGACVCVCNAAPMTAKTCYNHGRSQFTSVRHCSFFSAMERRIECRPWISWYGSRCAPVSLHCAGSMR